MCMRNLQLRYMLLLWFVSQTPETLSNTEHPVQKGRCLALTLHVCTDGQNSEEQGHISTFGIPQGNACHSLHHAALSVILWLVYY